MGKLLAKFEKLLTSMKTPTEMLGFETPSRQEMGRRAEQKVDVHFRADGWKTKLSPGSRGVADLTATKRGAKTKFIQVKYGTSRMSKSDKAELVKTAHRHNAKPILAHIADDLFDEEIDFEDL